MTSIHIRITNDREQEIRQRFRIACLKNGTSMQKKIYELMERFAEEEVMKDTIKINGRVVDNGDCPGTLSVGSMSARLEMIVEPESPDDRHLKECGFIPLATDNGNKYTLIVSQ